MRKAFYLIFISLLNLTFQVTLEEIISYGGNYGNIFKFIIIQTIQNENIINTSNIQVKISINQEEEKFAQCSIENNTLGQYFFYICSYEKNIYSENIYISKNQEYSIGIEIYDYIKISPMYLNLKFLKAWHLQFMDNIWQYDLIGEIQEEEDIPLGTLIYMDIKVNNINQIAGCILISNNSTKVEFSCKVNKNSQALTDRIIIPKEKSNNSTLNFEPQLTEDQNILVNKSVSFKKAEKLLYNNNKNIWEFLIIISNYSIPLGSKSIIDILYNGALSSAICLCNEPSILNCYVDLENQTEYDLVKIQFIKSNYSTIEWEDLTNVYEIPIEKELDFLSIYDLSFFQKSKIWKYKIKFENGILPQNSLVKVDFLIKNNITYDNCYHYNSILNCETYQIGNSSLILLSNIKKYGSITWRNLNKNLIVPINLTIN